VRGRVVLAGSSWGTRLAILYAAEHPERVAAVVLSGTPSWPKVAIQSWREHLSDVVKARLDSLESGARMSETLVRDSATIAMRNPQLPPQIIGRLARSGVCDDVALATTASWETLPELRTLILTMPVLVAMEPRGRNGGAPSPIWEEIRSSLLRAERVEIAEGGHDPWFSRSAQFFGSVRLFLASAR
jgi:pimeloyl-ACP methyl ester carboxylesterase